jgi:hypothetical protein
MAKQASEFVPSGSLNSAAPTIDFTAISPLDSSSPLVLDSLPGRYESENVPSGPSNHSAPIDFMAISPLGSSSPLALDLLPGRYESQEVPSDTGTAINSPLTVSPLATEQFDSTKGDEYISEYP